MKKWILGSLASATIIIVFSILINGVLFHAVYEKIPFTRSTQSWHYFPGMTLATILWSMILSGGFVLFRNSLPGRYLMKGVSYGVFLWLVFAYFAELFLYLLYEIPFAAVLVGWGYYALVFPILGVALAAIYGKPESLP